MGNEDALALDHRCANVGITVRTHRARFDRPFLLEIRERQSGTVEFTGKIVRMP